MTIIIKGYRSQEHIEHSAVKCLQRNEQVNEHYLASNCSVLHIQSPKNKWMEKSLTQSSQYLNKSCPPSLPKCACATETSLCGKQIQTHTPKNKPFKAQSRITPKHTHTQTHIHLSFPRCVWGAAPVCSPAKPDPGSSSCGQSDVHASLCSPVIPAWKVYQKYTTQ